MNDCDISLGRVFDEIQTMRRENKVEHAAITKTLSTHTVQLACLETKWVMIWRVVKYIGPVVGVVVGAVVAASSLL